MNRLIEQAHGLGYVVEFASDLGHSGLLMPGRILINSSKRWMTQQAALAHELGHIHYGHDWRYPHDRQRDEAQADAYAADLLIDPAAYAAAESMYESLHAIALELEVPLRFIQLWHERHRATLSHLNARI